MENKLCIKFREVQSSSFIFVLIQGKILNFFEYSVRKI